MEKMIVVDFDEYMKLLENYRKLDVRNRDLEERYEHRTKYLLDVLGAIDKFEVGEITKTELFYLIDAIMFEQGVIEND